MILNLNELKYYCLTIIKNTERINNIKQNFKDYNINFVYSDTSFKKYQSEALGFSRLIDKALLDQKNNKIFEPFVILEDDVSKIYNFPDKLDIPENTDLLYIGISDWGYNDSIKWAEKKVYTKTVNNYDNIVKIFNMLSQHGIIICSIRGAVAFQKSMSETFLINKYPSDNHTSSLQPFYNVYALKEPIVYQDSSVGGCEEFTKNSLSLNFLNIPIPNNFLSLNSFNYISLFKDN